MTSPCTRELEDLVTATRDVVLKLGVAADDGRGQGGQDLADALHVVQLYQAELDAAMRSGVKDELIKASNKLTTVNKGVADLFSIPDYDAVQTSASQLMDMAGRASKCLRNS